MDPTVCLIEALELSKGILEHMDNIEVTDAYRLAELVVALDEWMRKGGFPPAQWTQPKETPMNDPCEQRRLLALLVKVEAIRLYPTFSASERRGVQFGMFPHDKMLASQMKLLEEFTASEDRPATPEERCTIARLLAGAVIDCANAGPDQMVV